MNRFKKWVADWPGHPAMTFLVWTLIALTGGVVLGHMAQGNKMPEGYGDWYLFLGGLAGVNVTAMGIRRTTDMDYQKIKTEGAIAAASMSSGGPTDTTVTTTTKTETDSSGQPAAAPGKPAPITIP